MMSGPRNKGGVGMGTPPSPAGPAVRPSQPASGRGHGDDRILPLSRIVAAVVIVILILATWVLYFHPTSTATSFAWTIKPRMTPLLMGAGYGSAIYFYVRVLTERRWHRVALGFLPTTAFTWLLISATILSWGKFHHGSLNFALWLWIYIVTPVLVPGVWLLNRRADPGDLETRDALIPDPVRRVLIAIGAGLVAMVVLIYVWPAGAIKVWPWTVTPLTARTIAGFTILPGVSWLVVAVDRRWSAFRITVETVIVGLVLLLVAVARAWGDFDRSNPLTWVYVGGVAATLAGAAALYVGMERLARTRTAGPALRPVGTAEST